MKNYTHKRKDGSIVVTRFHRNRSYSKEYANINEYNKASMRDASSIWKVLVAPIYYPVKFVFKILYLLIKGIYWDLPKFIYAKIKR